ncbi:nicotinate phosphoribosyltransferase [[Eubacterium] cellulosolvens]
MGQLENPRGLFVTPSNASMLADLYELTMAAAYFENHIPGEAVFELFVRHLPKNFSYMIAAGLEQAVHYILNLGFAEEQIQYLRSHSSFRHVSEDFFEYLGNFRFSGDVWAAPEGTVMFPGEPLVQVAGSLVEAQIVETYLLAMINFQTLIASKASRVVEAAKGRDVVEFGSRRAHGPQAALLAARASYIGGCIGTSNLLAGYELGIPIYGTMAHSFIMAFDSELEAFKAYQKAFPDHTAFLIDTYNTIQGAKTAASLGISPTLVRLDSGDLFDLSVKVRRILDDAGHRTTKIFASGDLNEYRIWDLMSKGAPIDAFGVGTELTTSREDPALPGIYKLVELRRGSRAIPRVKLSPSKVTIPERKQVFRAYSDSGLIREDVVAIDGEPSPDSAAQPILTKVIDKGRLLYNVPSLAHTRDYRKRQVETLPREFKELTSVAEPPVRLSPKLSALCERLYHGIA